MTIDPRIAFWFGVWTSILLLIASGTISFEGALPSLYVPLITKWCAILGAINSTILTAASGYSSNRQGPMVTVPASLTGPVVKILIAAFALSMFLAGNPADARDLPKLRAPAVTGDIVADVKTDLGIAPPAAGVTKNSDGTVTCNFNVFANLNPKNLIATIQACVSDANSTFEPDVAAALDSANAYGGSGDQTGIQCLKPALAIVQAGIQRPAVAAVPAVPEQSATATSPAVPAVPAVAAVPAYAPGAITLFQKFREFTLAGGPTACQNWVQGTIQGAVAPVAGAVAGAAGAAALGGL
jgi:hypothetical protein